MKHECPICGRKRNKLKRFNDQLMCNVCYHKKCTYLPRNYNYEKRLQSLEHAIRYSAQYSKEYKQTHKKELREYRKKWDQKNKLRLYMGRGIYRALKENKEGAHWQTLVEYSLYDLRQHLESLFQKGMTWENQGKWHIDHVVPIFAFNQEELKNPNSQAFKMCWALENLQPLWAIDNFRKGNRLIYRVQPPK